MHNRCTIFDWICTNQRIRAVIKFKHSTFWPALVVFTLVIFPLYWSVVHFVQEYETFIEKSPWTSDSSGTRTEVFYPGQEVWIHWHTRINYDRCIATYSPRAEHMERAAPVLRFPEHTGHYTRTNTPEGKQFISRIELPINIQPGQWKYFVITSVSCWPFGFGSHSYVSPEVNFRVDYPVQ